MSADSKCVDSRPCFAKNKWTKVCGILTGDKEGNIGYTDGQCPFCKPRIDETNGVVYPFDPYYSPKMAKLERRAI